MGLFHSKNNWLCSDCGGGRLSTIEELRNDLAPVPNNEEVIVDYEITEFERCDEISETTPAVYSHTGNSSKVTLTSPLSPIKSTPFLCKTRVISRNASSASINLVDSIRTSPHSIANY